MKGALCCERRDGREVDLQERADDGGRGTYTEKTVEHYTNPRNRGRMNAPDGGAWVTGPCGDTMEVYLAIGGGRVAEALLLAAGQCMLGMRFQAGMIDPLDGGLLLEPGGEFKCTVAVALHAQRQRFQSLEENPGIEGAHAGTGGAQEA